MVDNHFANESLLLVWLDQESVEGTRDCLDLF
jgi:hypothetical protein